VNGRAFLSLALELATSDAEERRRSAISRAYYGAYHVARELVQRCDVIVPKRDVHNKLQWCLQQTGENAADKELVKAGSKLGDLRTERNKADYDLDDQSIAKVANVTKSVKRAEQIVDVLAALSAGAANKVIRQHVRSFAQQQGWQVR
jgi:uncharacterized protein (UPF0332 family)